MRAQTLRRWVAALLAPWAVALVLVPGLDGCPMHGLHAMARAAAPATTMAMTDVAAGGSPHAGAHGASSHHARPSDDAPPSHGPRCDCPGDCTTAADAVVSAPVAAPRAAYTIAFAASPRQVPWSGVPSRTVRRQPPGNGPPNA